MPRALGLSLVLLLLVPSLYAVQADLGVTVTAPASGQGGTVVPWSLTVRNAGPDLASAVVIEAAAESSFLETDRTPCGQSLTIPLLAPGEEKTFDCVITMPTFNRPAVVAARVRNVTPDPNPVNDFAKAEIVPITDPDVSVSVNSPYLVEPSSEVAIDVYYLNVSFVDVLGVETETFLPDNVQLVSAPDFCQLTAQNSVVCMLGNLAPRTLPDPLYKSYRLRVTAPPPPATRFGFRTEIRMAVPDRFPDGNSVTTEINLYKVYIVTNDRDSGSGSLREALETVSRPGECESVNSPCKISFRIPQGAAKWATIRPATPLPAVEGRHVVIDAKSQTLFAGDTNPDGPEVELSGELLTEGHGLVLQSICSAQLTGFAINGFPGHGVQIEANRNDCVAGYTTKGWRTVSDNYIGTDPTGMIAVPNLRGVVNNGTGVFVTVSANVISGNRHAGVFDDGTMPGKIENNRIGVTARDNQPLGNGASGVYIGPRVYGTDVNNNTIAFNTHAAIAIARTASYVAVNGNSMHGNHSVAIDRGLDGADAVIPIPVITSARYDEATDKTIVTGTAEAGGLSGVGWMGITLYANDEPDPSGYGEGQYALGGLRMDARTTSWTMTVSGDWRGKWLAATATNVVYVGWARSPGEPRRESYGVEQGFLSTTSEFSRVFEVK